MKNGQSIFVCKSQHFKCDLKTFEVSNYMKVHWKLNFLSIKKQISRRFSCMQFFNRSVKIHLNFMLIDGYEEEEKDGEEGRIDPREVLALKVDHYICWWCLSIRLSVFSKSRETKQNSSANNVCYWRDCVTGRVDHWWHTCLVYIFFWIVFWKHLSSFFLSVTSWVE